MFGSVRFHSFLKHPSFFPHYIFDLQPQPPFKLCVPVMSDDQVPMLANGGYRQPLHRLNRSQWWIFVVLNILFVIVGQAAAVLLGRFYYDKGGNSKWMASLVQTAAFPILFIPYLFLRSPDKSTSLSAPPPSTRLIAVIYVVGGAIIAGDNMLYSIGLLYLSASTYSLICATQLAFNALFAFFINQQKFTVRILISVALLSLSALLLATNDDSDATLRASRGEYVLGVLTTLAASALYSLVLSLMQLTFEVQKRETFSVVLDMQVYTSIMATCVTVVGLFASGEWGTIRGEMEGFGSGEASYIMTLVWTAVAWQIASVGVVGLIFVVSSLFSNAISTLSTAVTPIASLVVFHDKMNGPKLVAMLLAFLGFALYIRQNYLDDLEARKKQQSEDYDEFVQ